MVVAEPESQQESVAEEAEWTEVIGKKSKSPQKEVASSSNSAVLKVTPEDVEPELEYWGTSGFPMYDNKPLIVKPWTETCLLGKFLKRDGATEDKTRLGYARLLVEVEIGQAFPEKLTFQDEKGQEVTILVEYEWRPTICGDCKGKGHTTDMCKKKQPAPVTRPAPKPSQKVWRPVQKVSRQEHLNSVQQSPTKTYVEVGINEANKQLDVKKFLFQNNIGLYGLVETKIKERDFDSVLSKLGGLWKGLNNSDYHQGERVWVIWDPQQFLVNLLHKNSQVITVQVSELDSGDEFLLSVVYGSNDEVERLAMWSHLKEIKDNYSGPWGVCGDFNSVLHFNERIGREILWAEIADFRDCVDYCGLMDIKGQGAFYTCNNKQVPASRSFSRIDRFMVNVEWMDLYLASYAHFMPEGLFDHNPCVCYRKIRRDRRKFQFMYYNMWSLDSNFKAVVQAA
ncbi:uncharacterized protein LOC141588209 [Silene latifolia]|uniref:uncharacterized protein LOC141588209 n=1 Tax=Silene latifolia TaxID=37657 RepID=UPI003D771CC0